MSCQMDWAADKSVLLRLYRSFVHSRILNGICLVLLVSHILKTDGSKTENKVAAVATSDGLNVQIRLSGNASIFTVEL